MKFYKIIFFNTMIFGTLMTISAMSWFTMWMGLEINLLSIIPLMKSNKNLFPSEASIKYFITQTMASTIILLAIIMNLNIEEFIPQNSQLFSNMMMNSGLMTKMGAAPFHYWFPEVMEGLNWNTCLIMLIWQKIAPMIILMYNLNMTIFLSMIIIISALISGTIGLNQISLRKIMTYSSINHIGWMIGSMLQSTSIWMIYFITYSVISINIILIFKTYSIFSIKQIFNVLNHEKSMKFLFILNFLSLGGIPPFLGFLPKWFTINYLIENNFYFLSAILIVLTLITLYFYIRVTFSTILIYSSENIKYKQTQLSFSTMTFNFLSLSGLAICTFLMNF
uniref:NADH dehydrogenase subunit 2 n=1 Tax=Carpophilus pilosellus TaxID=2704548 RepID=UPI0013E910BA|nr:NADH dehydrogenase subunit 2 [Carpophilus pilosellus]QHR79642.1 NADH dehydrogenase subunit 2 [Carpophilus pilosellus]